jgi:hypothetical protein
MAIVQWVTANIVYILLGAVTFLVFFFLTYWIMVDRHKKKPQYNDTNDTPDDNTPNTIIMDERNHKRARACYVNYVDTPETPMITMPDGKPYYLFTQHNWTEGNEALALSGRLDNTPGDMYFADHDDDTGGLFPLARSFWEKALVGLMLLLVIILVIFGMCILPAGK